MSDGLRMELADCGSPERLIGVILKHHSQWKPPVPIEDFARTVGIEDFKDLDADVRGCFDDGSREDSRDHPR
jgi:hypothetical protein